MRTTEDHDGVKVIGLVFSIHAFEETSVNDQCRQDHRKIAKAIMYVEEAVDGSPQFYILLRTAAWNAISTEKLKDGTVTWSENPANCYFHKRPLIV